MQVRLGINKSPHNKINKSVNYTQTLTGSFKESFDEMNPEFDVVGNITNVNYAEINGKKYFIRGIDRKLEGLTVISLRLDLLSTYPDYIKNLDVYIERDSVGNPDIVDSSVVLSGRTRLIETWGDAVRDDEGVYVLTTSQEGWIMDVN